MSVRGIDTVITAKEWVKQAERIGKIYFWRSMDNHKEQMARVDNYPYTGIHALTYQMMVKHPWGQEYLKICK
jgi:hypothetical protein